MRFIILLYLTHVVWANKVDFYHELSMEEFRAPINGSFFGFSTTYDKYNKRLIIGAPIENNIGEVYQCNITTHECSKLKNNIKRTISKNYKHNFWFGATVRAGSEFIIACAPGFTNTYGSFTGMFGHCYKRHHNEDSFGSEIKPKFLPLSGFKQKDMETLGWDMDIGPDDSIIVGGPAMYKTRGLAAISGRSDKELKRITDIPANFNFGYSVAVGSFLNENNVSYAVGSTFGTKGSGEVYFYSYNNNFISKQIPLQKEEDIDLVGSMFGGVLCSAKLNKRSTDKPTDLLVGAPTYATQNEYNIGAVYVYVYSEEGQTPIFKRRIIGQKQGSFFGSAIIKLGDLNGDGPDEIAIGAPYEDSGRGAVYLYSGASLFSDVSEKNLIWMQKLQPEGYRSFGLSLAALKDHDENGCNELAISVPYDDKVVLYRCMAAITITKFTVEFPSLQNRTRLNKTNFKIKVCIQVEYPPKPVKIIAVLSTDVTISHKHAKLTDAKNGVFTFKLSLHEKKPVYCNDIGIMLPLEEDYREEISYNISTVLLDNPMYRKEFESPRVILSDVSKLTHTGSAWVADCSGDKTCQPILDLKFISSYANNSIYTIGSSNSETMSILVSNTGDVAYDPCVNIKVSAAKVFLLPMNCHRLLEHEDTLQCTSRKPLRTHWDIKDINLDTTYLNNKHKNITVDVTLFERCDNQSNSQFYSYIIKLNRAINVDIKGETDIGDIIGMAKDDLLYSGKELRHIYTIVNKGPSKLVDLVAEVNLQNDTFIKYLEINVTTQEEQDFKECEIVPRNNGKMVAQCWIKTLAKQNYLTIIVSMRVIPSSEVYRVLKKQNVTVNSAVHLFSDEDIIGSYGVNSVLEYRTAFVELWILFLAGVIGVCLMVILALILYECGCLRRKNKEDLAKLKKSVYRQSMRRSIMQKAVRDALQDKFASNPGSRVDYEKLAKEQQDTK